MHTNTCCVNKDLLQPATVLWLHAALGENGGRAFKTLAKHLCHGERKA